MTRVLSSATPACGYTCSGSWRLRRHNIQNLFETKRPILFRISPIEDMEPDHVSVIPPNPNLEITTAT